MKKRFLLFIIFSICYSLGHSQIFRYDVSRISKSLLANADAVIRTDQMVFELISKEKATTRVKVAVTILNKEADSYREVSIPYGKFEKVRNIKACYYDQKGKLVERISSDEIIDLAANYSSMLVSDDRVKYLEFPRFKYPFTIEYEYEVENKSLLFYPIRVFQSSSQVSVEQSGIQFVIPNGLKMRWYQSNLNHSYDSITIGKKTIYTWQEEQLRSYRNEPYSAPFADKMPILFTAPTQFKMDQYEGDLSTWNSFGKWVNDLNSGRDNITPEFSAKVAEQIKGLSADEDKVKVLYKYFQSITRYFNVSFGIGGWQPVEAKLVEKTGYGDCKALTNFMKSILASVGIKSYYTLVNAGDEADIKKDFPSQQFNHVFLCVPLKMDTMWLECTSQTNPPGYMGSFTDNRYVLLITEEGGKLVRTKYYSEDKNVVTSKGNINIDIMGNASARLNLNFYGRAYESVSDFSQIGNKEIQKKLLKVLHIPSFTIEESEFSEEKDNLPSGNVKFKLDILNLGSKANSRLIFTPGIVNVMNYVPESKFNFYIKQGFVSCDTIVFNLPYGFIPELMPEPISLITNFGSFESRLEFKNEKIYYFRKLIIQKGNFNSSDNSLTNFINNIASYDKQQIVVYNELFDKN